MQLTPYHAKYFAYELTKRSASDSIQKLASVLVDAQVDLNPHQVEAALFAFRSPLSKGAILADEVGLGKTIEAGLVISQKWAERKRRILIIVPSNLRKQWNQELIDKFFLPSLILESANFNQELEQGNHNPFIQTQIVLCSYQFARAKESYIQSINWDLVVIDEAHRLRNVYKPSNKIAAAIKNAVSHAPKILLTATPLQNSLMELFGLVSILDDFTFGDLKSFKGQFARITDDENYNDLKDRLKLVCKRTLRRQVLEYIKYTNRQAITQEFIPSPEEQRLYDLVSSYLQRADLYALPRSQRQLMTLILRKLLASSTFAISGTLDALSFKLESVIALNKVNGNNLDKDIANDYESIEELRDEWSEENVDYIQNESEIYTKDDIEQIKNEMIDLRDFARLAKSIIKNSKGEVLLTALDRGFKETERLGGNKKAVIFTESTRTQQYLKNILENTEYVGKIVLFNGSNNDQGSRDIYKKWVEKYKGTDRVTSSKTANMRAAIVDYFKDEAVIMIATEAAAEGINLQFCSLVVNYDLPWNPQRIEQRIGRCHRYGQQFDVVVVNFLNRKNAADQRVYQLLDEKFKLFNGVFGSSDEILGTIESGVDFEKRIAAIYQNCRTQDEIQSSFDDLQNELESQIEDKMRSTRQILLENFDEEVNEKLRINLEESKKYLARYENWLWQISKFYLETYAEFDGRLYSFKLIKNPFPDEIIHPGPYQIGKSSDDSNVYRIGHPLAQRIIDRCKSSNLATSELVFNWSEYLPKISILESYKDMSGWLEVGLLTIDSFESEDYMIICAITDDGIVIDVEASRRMFSLSAEVKDVLSPCPENLKTRLNELHYSQQSIIIQNNAERNSVFFDDEINKLDKWAEDVKASIETELKELDREIKTKKTESKKILNLDEKVQVQREIKEMEKKRNTLRQTLFVSQDDVDKRKESIIESIESRLKQNISNNLIFSIRWRII